MINSENTGAGTNAHDYEKQSLYPSYRPGDPNSAAMEAIRQIESTGAWTPEMLHKLDKELCNLVSLGRIEPEVIKKLRAARRNINKK